MRCFEKNKTLEEKVALMKFQSKLMQVILRTRLMIGVISRIPYFKLYRRKSLQWRKM